MSTPDRDGVLVTGGAGYIGSHAVLALREAGIPTLVLDNFSTGSPDALHPGVTCIRGDVGDAALVERVLRSERIGAVMHFAGSLIVPESVRKPLAYWQNNVANTTALLQACVAAGVGRFVFSSTAAVYGASESGVVDEDAQTAPINPYGSSKLAAEHMLTQTAAAHGMRVVILRYFNVAGADPELRAGSRTPGATHLVKVACEAALGIRDGMQMFGSDYDTPDGTCVRDYIHVSDLVAAHVLALAHLERGGPGLILNCGYGQGHSVRDVIASVARISGRRIAVDERPRRAGDPPRLIAQAARIRRILDWRPRHQSLDAIVASALAWERLRMQTAPTPWLGTG